MRGVNKVILIGNVGNEPKFTQSHEFQVTTLSIATNEAWKDKQTGELKTKAEWHKLVFTDKLAGIAKSHINKGDPIYVEGRLRTKKWQDKNDMDHYTTEVMVRDLKLIRGSNNEGPRGSGHSESY